jgi:hypothetical protein
MHVVLNKNSLKIIPGAEKGYVRTQQLLTERIFDFWPVS